MRTLRTVVCLLLVAALAGCAAQPGAMPSPSSPVPSAAATAGPPVAAALVNGFWRVEDAGEPDPTWLQLAAQGGTLYRPQGYLLLDWAAQGDAILVAVNGWAMSLGNAHDAPWLTSAATIEQDGDGWVVRDAAGSPVARLVRDGQPRSTSRSLVEATPPGSSASLLRDAVPGAGVVDRPAAAIDGTWHLPGFADVTLTFGVDGSWEAKPSCESGTGASGGAGGYRVLAGGLLLLTAEPVALPGCARAGSPSPDAKAISDAYEARSFMVNGGRLTLFDAAGQPLGTLVR